MRQMTIRNIDDSVYERLRDRAKLNQRSVEAEVRAIIDQSVKPDRSELARRAEAIRAKTVGRYRGDVVKEIREDRDR